MSLGRYLTIAATVFATSLAGSLSALATPLSGGFSISTTPGATITTDTSQSNLASASVITFNKSPASRSATTSKTQAIISSASGDYANYTSLNGSPESINNDIIVLSALDLTNLNQFTFSGTDPKTGAAYSFSALSAADSLRLSLSDSIVDQSANFLDIILYGTVSGLTAWDPTTVTVTINLNVSGTAIAGSLSVASLAQSVTNTQVPEPATLALFGGGLLAIAIRRRRSI